MGHPSAICHLDSCAPGTLHLDAADRLDADSLFASGARETSGLAVLRDARHSFVSRVDCGSGEAETAARVCTVGAGTDCIDRGSDSARYSDAAGDSVAERST